MSDGRGCKQSKGVCGGGLRVHGERGGGGVCGGTDTFEMGWWEMDGRGMVGVGEAVGRV